MVKFWLVVWLGAVSVGMADTVLLRWNPHPMPWVSFRVHAGTNSRDYFTNWPASENFSRWTIPAPGRWYFAVQAVNTNGDASGYSAEVTLQTVAAPELLSVPHVLLSLSVETSADLQTWRRITNPPVWIPATNAAAFYRSPWLIGIEKVSAP